MKGSSAFGSYYKHKLTEEYNDGIHSKIVTPVKAAYKGKVVYPKIHITTYISHYKRNILDQISEVNDVHDRYIIEGNEIKIYHKEY